MTIPQIGYCESFAIIDFGEPHSEFSDGTFLLFLIGEIKSSWIRAYLGDGMSRGRKEVEEKTEGNAEGEAVPKLCDWIGGLAEVAVGRREDEEVGEIWDAHETSTQGRALLVERGGSGGSLVEDVVISNGGFDYEARVGCD